MEESSSRPIDWLDKDSFAPADEPPQDRDPLSYPDYPEALVRARSSGSEESVLTGPARIGGIECEVAMFEFSFLGGSMGETAGSRLVAAMDRAAARRVPFVLFTSTGGARMQEGMRSLVQMPKVVSARIDLGRAGSPFVAVLGHPTTGGVLASVGALADVTLAVSRATVGFAGPRLVERQTGRPLRSGSHTAESALRAGLVDEIVPSDEVGDRLGSVLQVLASEPEGSSAPADDGAHEGRSDERPEPWAAVTAARDPSRARAPDLATAILSPQVELRGDRAGGNDPGVRSFLGLLDGRRVLVLALDRLHPPGPRGFRKAVRAVKVAGRLDFPVVTLVDTPGADASEDSEGGGIAWAIAELFEAMLSAPVPILSVLTGEGGSGGALAFACGDRLVAYDDAIFSVISPELASEILFRDPTRAKSTAELLRLTARDLMDLGIADELAGGPPDADSLGRSLAYHLRRLDVGDPAARRRRWRSI